MVSRAQRLRIYRYNRWVARRYPEHDALPCEIREYNRRAREYNRRANHRANEETS